MIYVPDEHKYSIYYNDINGNIKIPDINGNIKIHKGRH